MIRDKEATRARILAAVGTVLSRRGFAKFGINSIAKEAGVDKVLIYRYFGGLDRLLKAYAEENLDAYTIPPLAWPPHEKNIPPALTTSVLLRDQLEELRRRPVAQETLRWELQSPNTLTDLIATAREKMAKEYLARLPFDHEKHPDCDLGALFALLHAGITHMVASAPKLDYYQGIDLKSARGWKRIEQMIDALVQAYFGRHAAQPSK